MRSKQLAEPIKEHIRKKNEAASRRNLERQAAAGRARARQAEEEAQAKSSAPKAIGTKRKRESVQLEDELLESVSPRLETGPRSPMCDAFVKEDDVLTHSTPGQSKTVATPPTIAGPRAGAKAELIIDPSLNESCSTHIFLQPVASERSPEPQVAAVHDYCPVHCDTSYHRREKHDLSPAPSGVSPALEHPEKHLEEASSQTQQFPLLPQSAPAQTTDQRFLMPQQLLAPCTPTIHNGSRQTGPFVHVSPGGGPLAPASHDASSLSCHSHTPTIPLYLAHERFRQRINLAVMQVRNAMTELETCAGESLLASTLDQERHGEDQARHEMLSIARLGDELVQRVQGFAQRFGSGTARNAGMPS